MVNLLTKNANYWLLFTVTGACINHRDGLSGSGSKKDLLFDEEGNLNYRFLIYSDSKYVVDGVNIWLPNWKRNGWKNSKKQPIANLQMWKDLDAVLSYGHLRGVFSFYHVAGHSGNPGNDAADEAAREASNFARQERREDELHSIYPMLVLALSWLRGQRPPTGKNLSLL